MHQHIINKYALYSDHIKISYIDLYSDVDFAARYPDEQLTYGQILLECGDRHQTLSAYDLFDVDEQYGSIQSSTTEQAMTSAIMNLTDSNPISFVDRWCGPYSQNVEEAVGDFVLKRSDGLFAYQLAVIVDDHDSGITDIVRGADLIDNTPRQIAVYRALGWKEPRYMHIPLVLNDRHEKLSKQGGARPLSSDLLLELQHAWMHLGFPAINAKNFEDFYGKAVVMWRNRFVSSTFQKLVHK